MSGRAFPCEGCEDQQVCRESERCWRSPLPEAGTAAVPARYRPVPRGTGDDDARDAEAIYYDEHGRPVAFENCTPDTIISESLRSGFLLHDEARDAWLWK